jgi:hypothetical protein
MEEVWKDIIGFEGIYWFSNLCRVKSAPRQGVYKEYLKITTNKNGYPWVILYKNCKRYARPIHRLVLEYHVGLCPPGMECCHYNDIKSDYRIENLRWDTPSANQFDSIRNGTHNVGDHRGMKCAASKLVDENIPEIRKLIKEGIILRVIAKRFGVSRQSITDIKFNRTWSHIQ